MLLGKEDCKCILGGGAALGFAHIGAIKAITENVHIKAILGTSMGAIIGALFAVGYSPEEILTISEEKTFNRFLQLKLNILKDGILSTNKILDFFEQITHKKFIEECAIQYAAVAYDLKEKRTVIINKGSLASAMFSSSNLPFLNKAFDYAGLSLVDGGVCYPLPMEFSNLFSKDYLNIAVNVLPHSQKDPVFLHNSTPIVKNGTNNIIYNSMMVNLYNQGNLALNSLEHTKPDIYINCFNEQLKAWDFHKVRDFYEFGYDKTQVILSNQNPRNAMLEVLSETKKLIRRIKKNFQYSRT